MRRFVSLAACLTLVGAGIAGATAPADAAARHHHRSHHVKTSPYVALGDSYSSGAGISPLVVGAPATCSRSTLNFSEVVAKKLKPRSYTDATCSGADTSDFFSSQSAGVPPQLDAVTRKTRLVTMTIGGNDESVFTGSLFGCATVDAGKPTGNACQQKYGTYFTDLIRTQTFPHVVRALRAVHRKAPHAKVLILGYPQILPATGSPSCYALMGISEGDVPWLVHQEEVLNNVVRRAARKTHSRFVDTYRQSAGHDACSGPTKRWLEPLVGPVNAYPVHPNATGEAEMAKATLRALGR